MIQLRTVALERRLGSPGSYDTDKCNLYWMRSFRIFPIMWYHRHQVTPLPWQSLLPFGVSPPRYASVLRVLVLPREWLLCRLVPRVTTAQGATYVSRDLRCVRTEQHWLSRQWRCASVGCRPDRATCRMSACATCRPASGPAENLKSFGRRRRTKVVDERTRGQQAPLYGEFDF